MTESNDLLMNGANGAVPDYMKGVGEEDFGGGMDGGSYPRLAFKGSRFRLRQGDEEIVLEDNTIETIILRDFPAVSRIFFGEAYDPEGDGKPACASADGEHPVSTLATPQSNNCATCPQNQKGSAITDDGRKSRACGFYKRLIILIKGHEEVGPIICDVKAMSLFGDSKPNDNWWSLKAYIGRLKSNGVKFINMVTAITFDTDSSVPKVLFSPVKFVDERLFIDTVAPLVNTPDGTLLLEEMADTSKVRFEGEEDDAKSDPMLSGPKPDYMGAGEKPALPPAEPEPDPAEKKQAFIDGLKVDLKIAADGGHYEEAAALQKRIAVEEAGGVDKPEESEGAEALTPAQKSAITRKKNKAIKDAAAQKAADEAQIDQPEENKVVSEAGFDDELEGALKDFGF